MGQAPSQEKLVLEKRIRNPEGVPAGLAFVAHGRMGGNMNSPVTSAIADHLCNVHSARVVTWNARGMGDSGGQNEWASLHSWVGNDNVADYKDIVREEMANFFREFPKLENRDLYFAGFSAGAIYATVIRPPKDVTPLSMFKPAKYILVSYPVLPSWCLGLGQTGWYFRALEGIVGGGGWEGCSDEPKADVLTLVGSIEIQWLGGVYWWWNGIVRSKYNTNQGVLKQVEVDGADHVWGGHLHRIGEEVQKWLRDDLKL